MTRPWPETNGMTIEEYRRLVDQWKRNRLTWTKEDEQRLQEKVKRLQRERTDGDSPPR